MKKEHVLLAVFWVSLIGNICGVTFIFYPQNPKVDYRTVTAADQSVRATQQVTAESGDVVDLRRKLKSLEEELQRREEFYTYQIERSLTSSDSDKAFDDAENDYFEEVGSWDKASAMYKSFWNTLASQEKKYKSAASHFQSFDTSMLTKAELQGFQTFLKEMAKIDKLKQEVLKSSTLQDKMKYTEKISMMMLEGKGFDAARKVGLHALAGWLGYQGKEAETLINHVKYIYNSTSWGLASEKQLKSLELKDVDIATP